MKCPNCNHGNPDSKKFCAECGTKLDVVSSTIECPECHSLIPLDSKFCPDCGNKIEKHCEHTNFENTLESPTSFCCAESHFSFEKSQESGSYIDKTKKSNNLINTKESLMIISPLGYVPGIDNLIGYLYSLCSGAEDIEDYTDNSKCYRIKASYFDVSDFFGYPIETIQIHPEHRKIIYNIRLKRYFEPDNVPYSVKPFMDGISRKLCSIGIDIEEGPKTLLGEIWYSDVHNLEIQAKEIYPILWCDIIVKL